MQKEIKKESSVLDANGMVRNPGWSRQPLFFLDKTALKNRFTFSEKDSYIISSPDITLQLSVEENGIVSQVSALIVDFNTGAIDHKSLRNYMSFGRLNMPHSSESGDTVFMNPRVSMNFANTAINRYIRCEFVNFYKHKNLYVNLELSENIDESLNVLIPQDSDPKGFLLKRFMPAMKASGIIRIGGEEYKLTKENSYAYLNWMRLNTREKTCYHGLYADTTIGSKQFALCLCGGFGDVSLGGENCYFYDGRLNKLASVKAFGTEEKPHKPWHFTAGTNALDITFKPQLKGGHLLYKKCGKKTYIFGKLYGTIEQLEKEKITLDAVPAHLEFSMA